MIFYESFWAAAKCLPPVDRAAAIEAIVAYGCEGIVPSLDGAPLAVFLMAKPLIDVNKERKMNGAKGGRPRKDENAANPKTTGKFINFKQSDTDWDTVADQIRSVQ